MILTAGCFDSLFMFIVHIINTSGFDPGLFKRGLLFKIILNHWTNDSLSQTRDQKGLDAWGEYSESHLRSPCEFHVLPYLSLEIQMGTNFHENTVLGVIWDQSFLWRMIQHQMDKRKLKERRMDNKEFTLAVESRECFLHLVTSAAGEEECSLLHQWRVSMWRVNNPTHRKLGKWDLEEAH